MIKRAMVDLAPISESTGCTLHLSVHDELSFSVPPTGDGVAFAVRVREVMEDHRLRVPIVADLSIGADWGHCGDDAFTLAEAA